MEKKTMPNLPERDRHRDRPTIPYPSACVRHDGPRNGVPSRHIDIQMVHRQRSTICRQPVSHQTKQHEDRRMSNVIGPHPHVIGTYYMICQANQAMTGHVIGVIGVIGPCARTRPRAHARAHMRARAPARIPITPITPITTQSRQGKKT